MPNVTVYVISKQWADLPSKTTPIFAVDMTHIEQGIKNVTDFVNTLNAEAGLYLCAVPFTSELSDKLDGIEANANNYSLPTASTSTKGGVKVDGITITIDANGVISAVGGGGGSSTLSGLTDVQLNQLADGEILKWDAENSKWVNSVITEGSTYTKELVYDSGSDTVPAPSSPSLSDITSVSVNFLKDVSEYDQLMIVYNSIADGGLTNSVRTAFVDKDLIENGKPYDHVDYYQRWFRFVLTSNTTFSYFTSKQNESADQYPRIFKIYGIKFGGGSSVEPPTYNETMDILEGE